MCGRGGSDTTDEMRKQNRTRAGLDISQAVKSVEKALNRLMKEETGSLEVRTSSFRYN